MRIQFSRSFDAPAKARATVDDALESSGASDDLRSVALLLVSELVTNAVLHGDGEFVGVDVRCGDMVHVGVEDESRALPKLEVSAHTKTTGRGLHLVSSLADAWGVERTERGKSVWFTLRPNAA